MKGAKWEGEEKMINKGAEDVTKRKAVTFAAFALGLLLIHIMGLLRCSMLACSPMGNLWCVGKTRLNGHSQKYWSKSIWRPFSLGVNDCFFIILSSCFGLCALRVGSLGHSRKHCTLPKFGKRSFISFGQGFTWTFCLLFFLNYKMPLFVTFPKND